MNRYHPYLDWIEQQQSPMAQRLAAWSRINSGTTHREGLARMLSALQEAFSVLGGTMEVLECDPVDHVDEAGNLQALQLGKVLHLVKRPEASLKVFLGGHMDTVFGKDHPFQEPRRQNGRLNGPGAADLKGGLVVMLTALQALERSPYAAGIGWEVVINPDEEIGSPGSARLLAACARRNQVGLLYEPALADGTLAGARKGSGNFTVVLRGRAAHAGRDFHAGRNAIVALAEYTQALFALNHLREGVTINPGQVAGGGAVNMVPDLAILRFNVRVSTVTDQQWLEEKLDRLDHLFLERDGITLQRHGRFARPPKPISPANEKLFAAVAACGHMLGVPLTWQATGGCCDGNNLAAAGLPNVDTLGVRGGNLHSDREYALLDSLAERAKISALLLMRLASGEERL
ncbi:MAG: acetylornithine deacetylase [Desulfatitalea sp. BRH_c12]|nr:MAG: acetylornithine deacetylase [Desulfatitalea sp. BRH_c12]